MGGSSTDESDAESVEPSPCRRSFLGGLVISVGAALGLTGSARAKAPAQQPDAELTPGSEVKAALEERQDVVAALSDEGWLREDDAESLAGAHDGEQSPGYLSRVARSLGIGTDERAAVRTGQLNGDDEEEFVTFLHAGPMGEVRLDLGRERSLTRIKPPAGVDGEDVAARLEETVPMQSGDCSGDWEVPCTCPNEYGCNNITSSRCDNICGSHVSWLPSACNSCDCVVTNCCDCDCNCAWTYTCDCQCDYGFGTCNNANCC